MIEQLPDANRRPPAVSLLKEGEELIQNGLLNLAANPVELLEQAQKLTESYYVELFGSR